MARLAHPTIEEEGAQPSLQNTHGDLNPVMRSPTPVRRSARNARAGSVDSIQSESNATVAPSRRNKAKARAVDAKPELSILDEQEEPSQPPPITHTSGQNIVEADLESQALAAQLAGFANQASQELDVGDMVETLPALLLSSRRLLDLFQHDDEDAVETLARDLQYSSKVSLKYTKLNASFRPLRDFYGYDVRYHPFININAIVNTLSASVDTPIEAEGLGLILNVANLAIVVAGAFMVDADYPAFLQVLDSICPEPFASYVGIPGEAFDINLEIRTKLAVTRLTRERLQPDFNPVTILRSIFYMDEYQSDAAFQENPVPRKIAGDEDRPRNEEIARRYNALFETLTFDQQRCDVDEVKLNDAFSWVDFLRYIVQYTQTELDAITEKITVLGGSSRIVEDLAMSLGRNTNINHGSQGLDLGIQASLANMSQRLSIDPRLGVPRRLIDPHPDAERIQFDAASQQSTPQGSKRSALEMAEAPSQDVGFAADRPADKPPPAKRQPRRKAMGASALSGDAPPKAKRARKTKSIQTQISDVRSDGAVVLEQQARQHGTLVKDDAADVVPFSQISEQARTNKAMAKPKEAQVRKVWDDHDCSLLVDAISEYGSGWAAIANAFAGQWHRERCNQIDLKDKARNMKVAYLITDTPLPRGFDNVYLGKKEIVKIQKVGKNPYRREGEMPGSERTDMNGNLISLDDLPEDIQDEAYQQAVPDIGSRLPMPAPLD